MQSAKADTTGCLLGIKESESPPHAWEELLRTASLSEEVTYTRPVAPSPRLQEADDAFGYDSSSELSELFFTLYA